MLWKCCINMPENLENSAVASGLEKVSFHSNCKERQCQRKLKLLYNCTHLTCQQSSAQNSLSHASTVLESWISNLQAGFRKGRGTRDQTANIHWVIDKAREFQKRNLLLLYWLCQSLWLCGLQQTVGDGKLQEMGTPDHLTCILRNLYAGQEATARTGHETTDYLQIGKGVCQGCILSPCLFNLYAEYIMQNARLDEAQTGSRLLAEISIASDTQMTSPLW